TFYFRMRGFPALLLLLALPVDLVDFGCGWFSVITTALRKENSGTYQRGVQGDLKNILLQRIQMAVSREELVRLFKKKGNSLSVHCSYYVIANVRKLQHFIWCKTVSQIRCQPIIRGNSDQSIIKVGRTEMMNDFSWKMIRVWLKKLQLNDSGEYRLENHFQRRNKLLNRIMLEVLGETLYALMVLSSFLPITALIATVILLVTTYIRKKTAGRGMDFGRHSSFRQAALQKDRRNKASRMPEGELNDSTIYAVIRHQSQPKPEDVIYVNTQPPPQVFFHVQEPPGISVSSEPVEYATVIFRATTPHSGTEKTGSPNPSSTKPWAYSQKFAELHLETVHL
ncbi:LOW QUALITY PROTEIN: trem-like transcript 1 protein, partial [Leptosomus discolor]